MNQGRELSAARGKAGDNSLFDHRIADRTDAQISRSGREFRGIA
jgi:hypothetical protein